MEPPIITTGTILRRDGDILYTVELMNGKTILGHLSKSLSDAGVSFQEGAQVLLEMTPYDFDQGRITGAS